MLGYREQGVGLQASVVLMHRAPQSQSLDEPVQCCRLLAAAAGPNGEPLLWHWSLHRQGESLEMPGTQCWG